MEREKQIEEMAKEILKYVLKQDSTIVLNHEFGGRRKQGLATHLYHAGYRKERQGEWISVEDELPSKDGKYLVCSNTNRWKQGNVYQARYYAGHGWGQKDKGKGITHWMPLPEPPKMKGA